MTRDPGLQPERTALSWQRSTLAIVTMVVGGTHLASAIPLAGALLAGTAMATAVAAVLGAQRCLRISHRVVGAEHDGRPLFLLAAAVASLAFAGLIILLIGVSLAP
jgi:hypothetical protein